ncbi:MAG TPA: OmpA family protein [Nitrospira sp.]|jgi:peptidoglycan-associated lipoprotein|nr:OmpA family protein [Nitrospira sp.]
MYRGTCLVIVGCLMLWTAGCSKKSALSDGRTSTVRPPVQEPIPDLSLDDPNGERLSSGIAIAKNDPATMRRQRDEMRAEQAATAAAGLRDVFFGYDSWTISDEGRQVLSRDAEWLRSHPAVQLKVEGHCDERGSSTYNFVLAEKRAKVILNYLTDLGIRRERLIAVSYGKERPFCNDRSETCYQQNRRGHLVVKP